MSNALSRRSALLLGGGVVLGTAGAVVSAGTASAASNWVGLTVITANVGRGNLAAREPAIRAVRGYSTEHPNYRPLVGWQEINEGDTGEPAMIARHFAGAYTTTFLRHDRSYRVPISVPDPWRVVSSTTTRAHGGVADRKSPPRWLNEVVLRHANHPNLEFALLNTHYIANAYNGDRLDRLKPYWHLMKDLHRARVLHHHNQGRLVIWTADTNKANYVRATGRDAERRAFLAGVDRINWLPGNGTVRAELLETWTIDMRVDGHDARAARFRLRVA
ncbi:hypothetical protein BLA60_17940 [Actinophytocola xinjiangensis]|uniref:Endonuclease/exonuclease/phosphatase family protein n=1 Tax=Actinophytocola xinjiangensis TaxID=485602 RepID=A0A7Z0WLQ5_9PSEU|nr:hypothetical protein [Actinophytocola xinjiangensis]OLF09675.1 hypothetical protein BLA60_17940 [Actinophytocola xinjiangensis]